MGTAMNHLKKFFKDGSVQRKGTVIIGTVEGDLHDIGKNLVAMMVEGNGYEVIDLGVDVKAEKFEETKEKHPEVKTFIGGAPVTADFARQIGVDYYSDGPQDLVETLNKLSA